MWQRFTERARMVILTAQQEATRMGSPEVDAQHLFLGLLHNMESVAGQVLEKLGVNLDELRTELESLGPSAGPLSGEPKMAARAKRVLELSADEARRLEHNYIGTEHLLLGLLREEEGAEIVGKFGLSLEKARQQVAEYLGPELPRRHGARPAATSDRPPVQGLLWTVAGPIVQAALKEDLGPGDLTTEATVSPDLRCRAVIVAKEEGILAGLDVARLTFASLDETLEWRAPLEDGNPFKAGDTLVTVIGQARALLTGERTALNFLQRMSGIATATRRLVDKVAGTKARIVDTRKTVPGLRVLDKYAVRVGGGVNHRFGLYDAVLVKENHIRAAGGIAEAVQSARAYVPHTAKVEVETTSLAEVEKALTAGADIIMLDNMHTAMMTEAVRLIAGRAVVEASGNVTEDTVAAIAATGVDLISVGALTHSVRALDLSLLIGEINAEM